MQRYWQVGFLILGVIFMILTVGFFFQMQWATSLWMWQDGRLTYIFIASIMAALALPVFWMGLTGEWGAATGGAINLMIQAGGITLFMAQLAASGQANLWIYVGVFAIFTLANLGIFFWSRRFPIRDIRPTPRPVYYSFVVFVILLTIVSVSLLLKVPTIFPWTLKPETSVVIGWIFAGTAIYFSYPFLFRGWHNARGQLLGFLAYDLVLILPFLAHTSTVLPEHRLSLTIYIAVLVYSGALAVYYLFIHQPTRGWAIVTAPAQAED